MEKMKKRARKDQSTPGLKPKRKSGAQPENRNAVKLGLFTAEAKAELRRVKELINECKDFLDHFEKVKKEE